MEKISNFKLVIFTLRNYQSVIIQNPQQTSFVLKDEKIMVKTDNAQYILTLTEFEELFINSIFYYVEQKENVEIEIHKDDEYYAWKHK